MEKFQVDCYDILIVGIVIIGFDVNLISDLDFTIILYLFLLHILLGGGYKKNFTCNFFHELST